MAYYIVVRLLQEETFYSTGTNALGIQPKQMTPLVWDHLQQCSYEGRGVQDAGSISCVRA